MCKEYTFPDNSPLHRPYNMLDKNERSPEIFVLQGDNGGMMTMSNLTHKVSREDNGLSLTCEAFNKGTRFSSVRSEELIVYCEWPLTFLSNIQVEWSLINSLILLLNFQGHTFDSQELSFFKEINTYFQHGCIRLIKSEKTFKISQNISI